MSRRASALVGVVCLAALAAGILVAALAGSSDGSAAEPRWGTPERAPLSGAAVPTSSTIVDPAGRVHVAFVERRRGSSSLSEIVKEPGGRWSDPRRVVTGTPFAISIAGLAANARGDASIIWSYGAERRQVLVASTRTTTGAWGAEQALSRVAPGPAYSQIAMAPDGVTTVVGRGLEGPGLWVVRHAPSNGWSAPTRINPPGSRTDAPTLAVSADGQVEVVALLKTAGRPRVLWSRAADASGIWGPAMRIPGSAFATNATLAASGDGSVVASWVRRAGAGARRLASVRSRAAGWSAPIALDDLGTQQWGYSAAIPEPSGAIVLWVQWDARPEDRAVSLRSAAITPSSPPAPRTIESLTLAPAESSPGSVVIYGAPPVELRVASGPEPALMWSATSALRPDDPAAVSIATRSPDGSWSEPHLLSTPGRGTYPVATAAAGGRTLAAWMEAPPRGAANALLVAERR